MTGHERMNSKARRGFAIAVEKQRASGVSSPDKRFEFRHCLFPERAKANLPALSMDLHRTGSRRVPS